MLKGFNIATSFIFIVLTLEAVSDHKKICSMKVKVFRISAELKALYRSFTHFHKKDRKGLKKRAGSYPTGIPIIWQKIFRPIVKYQLKMR